MASRKTFAGHRLHAGIWFLNGLARNQFGIQQDQIGPFQLSANSRAELMSRYLYVKMSVNNSICYLLKQCIRSFHMDLWLE